MGSIFLDLYHLTFKITTFERAGLAECGVGAFKHPLLARFLGSDGEFRGTYSCIVFFDISPTGCSTPLQAKSCVKLKVKHLGAG